MQLNVMNYKENKRFKEKQRKRQKIEIVSEKCEDEK